MKRVVVLCGGIGSERDVSLVSGAAVAKALSKAGYDATTCKVGEDIGALVAALTPKPDAVFNALHGRYGEDGTVQGLLELVGVPYTHSGVLASALAMNKLMAKRLFRDAGIRCAEHVVVSREEVLKGDVMRRPYVIKPFNEGSSVGVRLVFEDTEDLRMSDADWSFGDTVMVERYIPGREITVAVMGERALGVTEIRPQNGFYDYQAKYTEGRARHLVPAPMHPDAYAEAMDFAVRAHQSLGCRGVSRADMRYDDTMGEPGQVYILEVNTQPGMTPLSLVPELAAHNNISFAELVTWMVENAACDA